MSAAGVTFGNNPGGPGLEEVKEFNASAPIVPNPGEARVAGIIASKPAAAAAPAAAAVAPAAPAVAPAAAAAAAAAATPAAAAAPAPPAAPSATNAAAISTEPAQRPRRGAMAPGNNASVAATAAAASDRVAGIIASRPPVKPSGRPDFLNKEVPRPKPKNTSRKNNNARKANMNDANTELPGRSELVNGFVNNNNARSASTNNAVGDQENNNIQEALPYNKELCTLLRFGPYDSNSEYVELNSEAFKTTKFQFNEMALGQAEMRKFYDVTSQNELEILQNVFGVSSLNKSPYFVGYKNDYSKNLCKFNGIEHVLRALQNRRETLNGQIKGETANAKKRRLQHQLEWFEETVGFLEKASSSNKACIDIPNCGGKKAGSSWWPFGTSGKGSSSESSGSESDSDCCFFDISLLYKIVVLINHLQKTAPNELKDKLKTIPIAELLKIAKNSTSKEDMTGHLKSVLGYLLEYLMALKASSGVNTGTGPDGPSGPGSIDPKILLSLYKAIDGSDKAKVSITVNEFMSFINQINLKLRRLIDMESNLRRIMNELQECRRVAKQGGPSSQNFTNLQAKLTAMTGERDKLKQLIAEALELVAAAKKERDAALEALEALRVKLQAENDENLKIIADLKATLAKVNAELAALKAKYDAAVAGQGAPGAEVAELRDQIDKLTAEKAELIELVKKAKAEEVLLRKSILDLQASIIAELAGLRAELAAAKQEIENLKNGRGGQGNQSRIQVLEALIKDTLAGIEQAKGLVDKIISGLEAIKKDLEGQIAGLQTELADTKAALEKLRAEHAADQQKLSGLQELINSAKAEHAAAMAALDGLRGRNKINTQAEIKRLQAELAAAQAALEDVRKSCGEKDTRIAALEAKINSTLEDLAQAKAELATAISQIEALKSAQSEKDQRTSEFVRSLIDKISRLQGDISSLRASGGLSPEQEADIKELKDAYLREFNKNLKKDELIKIYLDIIESMTEMEDILKEKLRKLLEEGNVEQFIIEIELNVVVFNIFFEGIVEKTIIIEDITAKEELKKILAKLRALDIDKADLLKQLAEAQAELASALSEIDKVKGSHASIVRDLLAKIDALNAEIATLRGKGGDQGKIDEALKDLAEAKAKLATALSQLDNLKISQSEKDQRSSEFVRSLIDKINRLAGEIATLRRQGVVHDDQDQKLKDWENAFYAEFNKNVEKDELIRIYEMFMDSLGAEYVGSLDKIKDLLRQLKEKNSDYDALIKSLEEEMQKDPVIVDRFFVYIIPLVETQKIVIEDLTAKEKLKDLIKKIKAAGAEKDVQITKLSDELAALKAKQAGVLVDLQEAKKILSDALAAIEVLRKKPGSSNSGTDTDTTTGDAGIQTKSTTSNSGTDTDTTTDDAGIQTDLSDLSIEELQAKVKEQEIKITNLKLKQVEYETKIRNLERDVVSKQGTIDAQLARITALEKEVADLKEANRQEMERLSGVLDGVSKDRDECKASLETVKAETERLKASLKTSEEQLAMCKSEIEAKDAQIAELRKNVGEKGECDKQIAALQAEKNALEAELLRLTALHADQIRIKDAALRVCEDSRRGAENDRDAALAALRTATDRITAEAEAQAALLERMQAEFEAALARAKMGADGADAASQAAIKAAEAARKVAEDARRAAEGGEADAKARAEAAEAAAKAAEVAQDAAVAAAAAAAGEAARSAEEAAAAKRDATAAMTDAAEIKAKGERDLAAAEAARDAAKAEGDAAKAALAEATRLREEADRLKAAADAALAASKEGRGANAAAVSTAQAAADEANRRAEAAEVAAKAAVADAAAQVAGAKADAEAARAAAEAAKADAETARTAADAAAKAKATADAAAEAAKGKADEAEAAKTAAEAARDAALASAQASAKDAAAARADAEAARAEANASRAAATAAEARAAAAGSGRNTSSAEAAAARAAADKARAEADAAKGKADEAAAAKAAALAEATAAKAEAAAAKAAAAGSNAGKAAAEAEAVAARAAADKARAEADAAKGSATEAEKAKDAALAETAAAKAEAAAAKAAAAGSNAGKAKAEQEARDARAAADAADAKAAKAASDADTSIAAARAAAEKAISDAQEAVRAMIAHIQEDLTSELARAKGQASAEVQAAQAAMRAAQAAATASDSALARLRAQLEAETGRANAATKRAETAEGRINQLEEELASLRASLEECQGLLTAEKADNAKTHALLDKLLVLVATDDDIISESSRFRETDGEFKDFRKLKGGPSTAPGASEDKDICVKKLTELIGRQLNNPKIANLPEDIFSIYGDAYNVDEIDQKALCTELSIVLGQSKNILDNVAEPASTIIELEVGQLTGLIGKIAAVNKPNIDFLDQKLQKFALSVSGKVPSIVNIKLVKDVMKGENIRKIPVGILAIKFLQLCKKYGILCDQEV